ncbi:MAG: hypothetical protein K1060chlam2_00263 [Chlamydiae bacterium]|nr:hypothetical protein [Chlamydiota bacterium]
MKGYAVDDAGKKRYAFWMRLYPHLRAWPAPYFKSPGDTFQARKENILNWVKSALFCK